MLGLSTGSQALPPEGDAAAAALAAAATHLRQAAGVYEHLAEMLLPPLFAVLKGDRCVCLLAEEEQVQLFAV